LLRVTAPAKVNLHLAVGPVGSDGYHTLTGVFHALELADEISIRESSALSLHCETDLGVPATGNLAYRAAVALGEAVGRVPAVEIGLTKRIPHGAGLGGGSSDAAAVIAGLAALWGLDPASGRCTAVAASLGADVPFFLVPGGCALMVGRGDVVERPLPALAGAPVVLLRPADPVSTAAAYAAFDERPVAIATPDGVIRALDARDALGLGASLVNNLAAAAISIVPAIADALAWVRCSEGVLGSAVSGSGSAVFALCDSVERAGSIARAASEAGWWSTATALGGSGVAVRETEG